MYTPIQTVPCYFFEVYTNGPKGETGWDIEVGFVLNCKTRDEAVSRVKTRFGRKFDTVIQCHESLLHPLGCKTTLIR